MAKKTIIAFDLYGTLLSTDSIADSLVSICDGDNAKAQAAALAALWRRYQLEYTWRINSMETYRPFDQITRGALLHAAKDTLNLTLPAQTADTLMQAYNSLHVFPEIPTALQTLRDSRDKVESYIFSNGTRAMVSASVDTSPELSPHAGLFKGIVSVDDDVRVYKPDRRTYTHLAAAVGTMDDVWVVSANPFDAVGAVAAGLKSVWVDRAGKGWVDQLGDVIGELWPTRVVAGVDEGVAEILKAGAR